MKSIQLSSQQINAIDCVRNPKSGNLLIEAVAGSGKTFTLLEILKALDYVSVAFCAYSKNISVEIKDKVDAIMSELRCKTFVGTCHSFGNSALRRFFPKTQLLDGDKVPQKKVDILLEETRNAKTNEVGVPLELRSFVRKAYTLARQWGVGVLPEFPMGSQEAWLKLVDHFDLEDELIEGDVEPANLDHMLRQAINWTVYVIKAGVNRAAEMIDFEDMIYIVLAKNIKMWQYDIVLVDECQDLNPTRRAMTKKMLKVGGRAVFVGDPRQAIFGFTGADDKSIENITREFGCTTLPLTYSFRCPKSVVRFAQSWVSHIESTPDAPEGLTETIDIDKFWSFDFNSTDAILCRNNAPLVELFFSLLSKGIASHIEGKDIAAELIKTVNRFPKVKTIPTLIEKLEDYRERMIQKWNAKGKEQKAERMADCVDAILVVAKQVGADGSVADLKSRITSMFEDTNGNRKSTLTLTTIHKAKGREWNRVFWYGRNQWNPSKYARKDWQIIAEANLCYVAATRSKNELYDVIVPSRVTVRTK
jgi:superfamily I DNA/RNA helicase